MSAGYSPNPLVKKLGIKENCKMALYNTPENYFHLLGELPAGVELTERDKGNLDFIHLFLRSRDELENEIGPASRQIRKNGMIWISWYKKASGIPTDITEDVIREVVLPLGLVDIKVCAVDEKWSGLKIVWRKELR